MMEISTLIQALAVADHGGFRGAARELGVQVSSVSARVRTLEDELGVSLFERLKSGASPTRAGQAFLGKSREIIAELEAAAEEAEAAGRGEVGRLTIGFFDSLASGHLRETLLIFVSRHPRIGVQVRERASSDLRNALRARSLDVIFLLGEADPSEANSMTVWSESMMVALTERHQLAAMDYVLWSDLRGEKVLVRRRDLGPEITNFLSARIGTAGRPPILVRQDVGRDNILNLVGAGLGVHVVTEAAAAYAPPGVLFRPVYDSEGPAKVAFSAHWVEANDNPAMRRFLSLLRSEYGP